MVLCILQMTHRSGHLVRQSVKVTFDDLVKYIERAGAGDAADIFAQQIDAGQIWIVIPSLDDAIFFIHPIKVAGCGITVHQVDEIVGIFWVCFSAIRPRDQLEYGKSRQRNDLAVETRCKCHQFGSCKNIIVTGDVHDDLHVRWPGDFIRSLSDPAEWYKIQLVRHSAILRMVVKPLLRTAACLERSACYQPCSQGGELIPGFDGDSEIYIVCGTPIGKRTSLAVAPTSR